MKYEVSYVMPNGTKWVYGIIEKDEEGQYLADHGRPHKTAYKSLTAAVESYELCVSLRAGVIIGFSVNLID